MKSIVDFVRHNIFVGLIVIIKALFQMALLKIVALKIGLAGIGEFGQATNIVVMSQTLLCTGAINFIIKEYDTQIEDEKYKKTFWSTLFSWSIIVSGIAILVVVFFSKQFSIYIFNDEKYQLFFIVTGVSSLFVVFQSYFYGLLSSLKMIQSIFWSHLIAYVILLVLFYTLVINTEFETAITGYLLLFVLLAFTEFYFIQRDGLIKLSYFRWGIDRVIIRKLLSNIAIVFATGTLYTLYLIFIRRYLLEEQNRTWAFIGEWQAILKVSEIMSSFLGISILTLYFPVVSRLKNISDIKLTVKIHFFKNAFLIFCSLAILSALSKLILRVVFSEEFVHLHYLLELQFVGDFFRLLSWIFTYLFLIFLPLTYVFFFEASYVISLFLITQYMSQYGLRGIITAQVFCSILFFCIAMVIYYIKFYRNSLSNLYK